MVKVQVPLASKASISWHIAVCQLGLETASEYCVGSTPSVTQARNYRCDEENLLQLTKCVKEYWEVPEEIGEEE